MPRSGTAWRQPVIRTGSLVPRPDYQMNSLGITADGMLAEHVVVHENGVFHLPDYMSYIEAASLPCAAVTAWTALHLSSPLQPGQKVLVQGTGGVALFAYLFAGSRVRYCPDHPRTHIRNWGRCIVGARTVFGGHPEECAARFPC